MPEGIVTKGVNGFFTVQTLQEERICKARGVFRKRKIQVVVGDRVMFEAGGSEGVITEVLPRHSELTRPPIVNVDQAILVCSCVHPDFQPGLLDRMLVAVLAARLQPLIVMNKCDLVIETQLDRMVSPYDRAGYPVLNTSANTGRGLAALNQALSGVVSVFVGPSGVGKSSLANAISPELGLQMGEISERMDRGKHTTRHVQLYALRPDTFVADTPGFSQLDVAVMPADIRHYFWEFSDPAQACAYRGCLHTEEVDCGVKAAVSAGSVASSRYESYLSILTDCKEREERRY